MQPGEQLVFPYENVLIPTDGSTDATRAAQHGLALAESLEATVHVLSVVDEASLGLDTRSISEQDREQAATKAIEGIIAEAETRDITDTVTHRPCLDAKFRSLQTFCRILRVLDRERLEVYPPVNPSDQLLPSAYDRFLLFFT